MKVSYSNETREQYLARAERALDEQHCPAEERAGILALWGKTYDDIHRWNAQMDPAEKAALIASIEREQRAEAKVLAEWGTRGR